MSYRSIKVIVRLQSIDLHTSLLISETDTIDRILHHVSRKYNLPVHILRSDTTLKDDTIIVSNRYESFKFYNLRVLLTFSDEDRIRTVQHSLEGVRSTDSVDYTIDRIERSYTACNIAGNYYDITGNHWIMTHNGYQIDDIDAVNLNINNVANVEMTEDGLSLLHIKHNDTTHIQAFRDTDLIQAILDYIAINENSTEKSNDYRVYVNDEAMELDDIVKSIPYHSLSQVMVIDNPYEVLIEHIGIDSQTLLKDSFIVKGMSCDSLEMDIESFFNIDLANCDYEYSGKGIELLSQHLINGEYQGCTLVIKQCEEQEIVISKAEIIEDEVI